MSIYVYMCLTKSVHAYPSTPCVLRVCSMAPSLYFANCRLSPAACRFPYGFAAENPAPARFWF